MVYVLKRKAGGRKCEIVSTSLPMKEGVKLAREMALSHHNRAFDEKFHVKSVVTLHNHPSYVPKDLSKLGFTHKTKGYQPQVYKVFETQMFKKFDLDDTNDILEELYPSYIYPEFTDEYNQPYKYSFELVDFIVDNSTFKVPAHEIEVCHQKLREICDPHMKLRGVGDEAIYTEMLNTMLALDFGYLNEIAERVDIPESETYQYIVFDPYHLPIYPLADLDAGINLTQYYFPKTNEPYKVRPQPIRLVLEKKKETAVKAAKKEGELGAKITRKFYIENDSIFICKY